MTDPDPANVRELLEAAREVLKGRSPMTTETLNRLIRAVDAFDDVTVDGIARVIESAERGNVEWSYQYVKDALERAARTLERREQEIARLKDEAGKHDNAPGF